MERFLNNLHFGTRILLIFMVILHIINMAFFDDAILYSLCLIPSRVIKNFEFWRLITAPFLHSGIIHLAMNMGTFLQVGMSLESAIGTLSFFYHIIVFGFISSVIDVVLSYILTFIGEESAYNAASIGFSGVLFALTLIDISITKDEYRSVFGILLVPSQVYPWIILIVLQVLMPNISLIGHLSGLLVGYMYQSGLLKWITLSPRTLEAIERRMCCCCTGRLGYQPSNGQRDYQPFSLFRNWFQSDSDHEEEFVGEAHTL